ncbi:MAG: alpha/beta hydrolase-fold protein [Chitinophagaceae bacterium]
MQKWFFSFSFYIFSGALQAQHSVIFRVKSLPAYHKTQDPVFIAGSFNNWNPGQREFQLKTDAGGKYFITIALQAGKHEYKITRGNWETVESGSEGFPTENRVIEINSDTSIEISIQHWADHFPKNAKVSTANKHVKIIETGFFIPQLNRHRRIWVYLPETYANSRKKYPVLYMHDGQNVFDDSSSFSGEWGVDEALDTLGKKIDETIVVAVDNGGNKRINEYSPYDMERFGKGEGNQYVDFLVKTLMPYINKNYRTKKCGKNSYVTGSSMGGLISLYAMLKYPKEFDGAGIFSPAFWITPQLKEAIGIKAKKIKGKIYFYAGKQESESMVPDMLSVFERMNRYSKAKMTTIIRSEGKHNEATWRKEFPLFYKWMFTPIP